MECKPCVNCGARVTSAEIRQGDAIRSKGKFYCFDCANELGIGPGSGTYALTSKKKSLTDSQFFKRAGKLYSDESKKKHSLQKKKSKLQQKNASRSRERKPAVLIIAGLAGLLIVLILFVIIILVSRK